MVRKKLSIGSPNMNSVISFSEKIGNDNFKFDLIAADEGFQFAKTKSKALHRITSM